MSSLSEVATSSNIDISTTSEDPTESSPVANSSEAAPITEDVEVEPITSTINTSSSLDIDPAQLIFRLGLSPSPNKSDSWPPQAVGSLSATVSPVAVTSSERHNAPDVFGNYVRASASTAPRRFNFDTSPSGASTSTSKTSQQPKPGDNASIPHRHRVPVHHSPIIPNLGPDVTIKPVTLKNAGPNKFEATSSSRKIPQTKPSLDSNEMFKLLAGYNHLTTEVANLKTQLAEKETLIHEILGSFSTEVAILNNRLTAVEKELKISRKNEKNNVQDDVAAKLDELSLTKDDGDSD